MTIDLISICTEHMPLEQSWHFITRTHARDHGMNSLSFLFFSGNKSSNEMNSIHESIYYRMLPLPILIIFTLAYNVGMGCLTWVVATEILPFRSRRWTHTVANVTSNLCWFAVTKTYTDISKTFGISVPFFIYGSVCLFGFVFIYVFLPETRGKTPEETAKAFR